MNPQSNGCARAMWFASSHLIRQGATWGWAFNLIVMKFLGRQSIYRRRVIGSRAGKRDNHKLVRRPPAVDAAVAAT